MSWGRRGAILVCRTKGGTGGKPLKRDLKRRAAGAPAATPAAVLASMALQCAASFAGAFAAAEAGRRRLLDGVMASAGIGRAPVIGPETVAPAAGASGPAAGGIGFDAGGIGSSLPAGPACGREGAAGTGALSGGCGAPIPAPAPFFAACLKPGAVRDYLRARYPGPKPQHLIAEHTGVPADTIRKAISWREPSELSGPHLMRLVAVYGPAFVAAVMDPVPDWARGGEPAP